MASTDTKLSDSDKWFFGTSLAIIVIIVMGIFYAAFSMPPVGQPAPQSDIERTAQLRNDREAADRQWNEGWQRNNQRVAAEQLRQQLDGKSK